MEKETKKSLIEVLGWIGAIAVLFGYALVSLNIVSGDSRTYHTLMLLGSAGLAVVTLYHRSFQPFLVNIVFTLLASIALIRLMLFT